MYSLGVLTYLLTLLRDKTRQDHLPMLRCLGLPGFPDHLIITLLRADFSHVPRLFVPSVSYLLLLTLLLRPRRSDALARRGRRRRVLPPEGAVSAAP